MIEIHSHLLYGLDDGAADIGQSLELLEDYLRQGVTDVVCTPHFEPVHYQSESSLTAYFKQRQTAYDNLMQHIAQKQWLIRLHLGAEIMLSADVIRLLAIQPYRDRLKLAGSDYILIELPRTLSGGYKVLDQLLFRIQISGLTPILAHPERSMSNGEFISALQKWIADERVLLQVNASSFVQDDRLSSEKQQHYNSRTAYIWQLAEQNLIHFVASDAHHPVNRPVQQDLARRTLAARYGSQQADRLTRDNPLRILSNEALVT